MRAGRAFRQSLAKKNTLVLVMLFFLFLQQAYSHTRMTYLGTSTELLLEHVDDFLGAGSITFGQPIRH